MSNQLNDQDREKQRRLRLVWDRKRHELGLTQIKARDALGLKYQSTVSQYLNGQIPLNTETVLKFANLLRCDPAEIDPAVKKLVAVKVAHKAVYLGVMQVSESGEYELMRTDEMPKTLTTPLNAELPEGSCYMAISLEHNGYRPLGYYAHSLVYIASNLEPHQGDTVYITVGDHSSFYRYVSEDLETNEIIVKNPLLNMRTEYIRIEDIDTFGVVQAVIPQSQKEKRLWPLLKK